MNEETLMYGQTLLKEKSYKHSTKAEDCQGI